MILEKIKLEESVIIPEGLRFITSNSSGKLCGLNYECVAYLEVSANTYFDKVHLDLA